MTIWWCVCAICGDHFTSNASTATDCGNARKHAKILADLDEDDD